MFQNLKLSAKGGFPVTIIESLGKINIICGKNNSGKSTVLSVINEPKLRFNGKWLNENGKTQISTPGFSRSQIQVSNTPNSVTMQVTSDPKLLEKRFAEIVTTVSSQKIWYEDEYELFAHNITEQGKSDTILQFFSFGAEPIIKSFKQILAIQLETIYIEAKRSLKSITVIDSDEPLLPNGTGILNYLFQMKNQIADDAKKETFQKIREAFTEISDGYKFDIHMESNKKNQIALMFADKTNVWRKADVCGLGLQDLLTILTFIFHPKYSVILIEEPENHLHPDMQRKLLGLLINTQKQYFLSTHSNIFLNSPFIDRVFLTRYINNSIIVDDITSRATALHDLGYSIADNLVADLVILVEGPTDIVVIEELLIKMNLYPKYNIKFWPLGGNNMKHVDLEVLTQNYNVIALVDRDDKDPNTAQVRIDFITDCQNHSIFCYKTLRYAIENYFTVDALEKVFPGKIAHQMRSIDPDLTLEEQLKLLNSPVFFKAGQIKKYNRDIAKQMLLPDIQSTDLNTFLTEVEKKLKTI